MLENATQCLKNYIYSDYDIDRQVPQGYWTIKGRLISLIDIPSQVLKTVAGTSALLAVALYKAGAAGVLVTFKVIPKAILSHTPGTDKNYWKEHSATHWDDTKQHLTQFKRYAVYGATYFCSHVVMPLRNILSCTVAPNFSRIHRAGNAITFHSFMEHSNIEQFHRNARITTKIEPIKINITQFDPNLKVPMEEIIKTINEKLLNGDHKVISDRVYQSLVPENLPHERHVSVFGRGTQENSLADYANRRPGDTTDTVVFANADRKTAEETIMGQCLKQLVEANAIYSYDKFGSFFFIQA